jgi:hypothetical protein
MASERLASIAKLLGKEEAFSIFIEALATEEAGDCNSAIQLYKRAFKMWDALQTSMDEGGLPTAVRREAEAAGIDCCRMCEDVSMSTDESRRFDIDATDEWMAYLKENGYCVLAGAADAKAVAEAKVLLWEFLESAPGSQVKRDDASTWDAGWLPNVSNGILGVHGVGQSPFCWHTRLLPKVRRAFEAIWDCKDVIASFDGGNVFRPWASKPEWRTDGGWWHVDQNAFLGNQDGFTCVQGLLTFTDATPATGGLCVIPGSHNHHKDVCTRAYAHILSGHNVPVPPGDPVLGSGAQLVCARAGDLVLWDSRCVHCNTPGSPDANSDSADHDSALNNQLLRVVAYVCMTPASWASSDVLAQRKQGFLTNQTTDHLPHEWHGGDQTFSWPPLNTWEDTSLVQKHLIVGASSALLDPGSNTV